MAGKPFKPPKGFLSPAEVAQRAAEKGFRINPKNLAQKAHEGKVPFGKLFGGRKKGIVFPETALYKVIAAAPKEAILPKGLFTPAYVYRIAKKKGLKITAAHIKSKIDQSLRTAEPLPGTLSQDAVNPRHRFLFDKRFVNSFLRDAVRRKNLPEYLARKLLLPVEELAQECGVNANTLFKWSSQKKLKTHFISGKAYVTIWEAERFKKWHKTEKAGTREFKGGKARKGKLGLARESNTETLLSDTAELIKRATTELEKTQNGQGNEEKKANLKAGLEERQQHLDEARKRLLDEGKHRIPDLLLIDNLQIVSLRLEALQLLLSGMTLQSTEVQVIIQEILRLQEKQL